MAVRETFVHVHNTKQTINYTQTLKIKCIKLVSISNCYVKICLLVVQLVKVAVFKYHNNGHHGKA